jgi:hypothetical protein
LCAFAFLLNTLPSILSLVLFHTLQKYFAVNFVQTN